jgi:superfamily II DNA or RNA helicase
MLKVYIADKIYIKMKDLPREVRQDIVKNYMFTYKEYDAMSKRYIDKTVNLMEIITWKNDEKWVSLPCNLDYFLSILKKHDINFLVSDRRANPRIEKYPNVNIIPREEQMEWLNQLEEYKYNAIMALPTGSGKSLLSVYLGYYLKVPMLFTASKTSYIKSFKSEVMKFVDNWEDNYCEINTEWLRKGAEIKPYMTASIQALQNEDILEALKDKFSLLVADELHLGMLSKERRKVVYGLNPKYRVYLSATPNIVTEGYINAVCSPNVVTSEGKIDFNIKYLPINIDIGLQDRNYYKTLEQFHEKKNFIFTKQDLINGVREFVQWQTQLNRGCLIFNTNSYFQETIAEELNKKGIKAVCFNKNTKKNLYDKYFEMYDNKDIDVIIGGTAVVEALSLYRLSCFIDTNLSETPNQIIQKVGRLKRRDEEISDKEKVYIKFIYKGITENKFKFTTLPTLKTMDYLKVLPTQNIKGFGIIDLFI